MSTYQEPNEVMARPLASMALPAATLASTQIAITSVTGNMIGVTYNGLSGNNPGGNSNFISVFQNTSPDFPFGTTNAPVATANVTGSSSGSLIIPGTFAINTAYVVGYGVGPKMTTGGQVQPYGNICASAFIPAIGTVYPSMSAAMTLVDVQANSVAINYNVLQGLTPGADGAWAGLWVNNDPSYTLAPQFFAQITSNMAVGGPLIFNGVSIPRGSTCSVALFSSGWLGTSGGPGSTQTAMVCTLQFSM